MLRKVATNPVMDHPFVTKLNRSIPLDDDDLIALARLLDRKVVVKKTKDIIVEGYAYRHEVKILDMAALQILGEFHPAYLARTPIRDQRR
jgi:hypothetical protein